MASTGHDQGSDRGKPSVTILVNTRSHPWADREISFEQVYDLAYPDVPLQEGDVVRVEYSRGPSGHGGSLTAGHTVKVKDGMVFDVYPTSRS